MKERSYGDSWKRRGGIGAYMMLARKMDRLENMVSDTQLNGIKQYDVFDHISRNPTGDDGTVLAEIRDLRRYLILVEAEMIAKHVVKAPDHLTEEQRKLHETPTSVESAEPFGFQLENEIGDTPKPMPFGFTAIEEDVAMVDTPTMFTPSYGTDLTSFEYNSIKDTTVSGGSMYGHPVRSIYVIRPSGRYHLAHKYVDEYGQT